MLTHDLLLNMPILVLLLTGLALMLLDAFKVHKPLPIITAAGLLLSMLLAVPPVLEGIVEGAGFGGLKDAAFGMMVRTNGMALVIHFFLVSSGLFTLFFLRDYFRRQEKPIYDTYALLVFSIIGMILLANANDLIITFIGLETMSICLYIMAALFKKERGSNEAGLKYFLLGAFATGFFLYGIALIYGSAGSTNFTLMNFDALVSSPLFYPGLGMLIIGFLFKVSAFPFHMWTPDVYTGTPTPLAGFMSTGGKAAAFISLTVFMSQHPAFIVDSKLTTVILVVAVATMLYGNIVAAQQRNLKRLLAYSSIAHSGYVLLAVCAGRENGALESVTFYMVVYTLMNIGAFGILSMAEKDDQDVDIDSWRGAGLKNPWLGVGFSVMLLSLAGIPPLAGFMGKYFVFASAINAEFIVPAVIGIITSVVGAYYYIRVIRIMFFDPKDAPSIHKTTNQVPKWGIIILGVLILLLGVYPNLIQDFMLDMGAIKTVSGLSLAP